jgi:hypothetical protein
MTRRISPLRLVALVALLASVSGCLAEENGLPYDRLRIAVARPGSTSVAGFPRCVTLPVLNGSVVEETHPIEGGLSIEVFATNSAVDLAFSGASQGPALDRTISVERLRAGYAESFELSSVSGTPLAVSLGSGCSEGDLR